MVTYRARIKGAYVAVSSAGTDPVTFYDNASAASGTILLQVGANAAGCHTVVIPGEGILAENGIFCDTGSAAAVTLFYG
jgi:hypothetical protein